VRKLLIIILTSGFLSCSSNVGNFDFEKFLAEFQKHRAAWESLGIDHYRFTTSVHGGPRQPDFVFTVFPHSEPIWRHLNPNDARREAEIEAELGIVYRDRRNPILGLKGRSICEFFESLEDRILTYMAFPERNPHTVVRFYARYNAKYFFPEEFLVSVSCRFGGFSGAWVFEIRFFEDLRSR